MLIYDSTNAFDIPADAPAVAGYVDGIWRWSAAAWARFPNAHKTRIACFPSTNDGDALDVELGDATPAQASAWVKMRRAAGVAQPWVYCNRANRPFVEAALQAAGIEPTEVALWVATLDGTESVPPRLYPVAAIQYANSTLAGGHYDISILTTYGAAARGIGVDDLTPEQDTLLRTIASATTGGYWVVQPGTTGPNGEAPGTDIDTQLHKELKAIRSDLASLGSAVAAIHPGTPADLSGITAALSVLNAKVDAIATRLAKDLA